MDSELQSLRKELAELGDEFSQKIQDLERRIDLLTTKQSPFDAENSLDINGPQSKHSNSASVVVSATAESAEIESIEQPVDDANSQSSAEQSPPLPSRGIAKEAARQSLFAIISPIMGPFSSLLEQFSKLYLHYQKQGKAPVFFMTLTGVVALVFGFGYLLQYSFNEYLGPVSKITIGFVIAIATTCAGVWFTKKRPEMAEYGSSIIALGVVLNYLCGYFAGPYYGLLPDLLGFLLLVAVTAIAYVLALLFETRVVAAVTLVGGAAMPLVMGHVDQSPLQYLSYLLVLACAMLTLSRRIRWQPLAYVTIALSAGMVEFSIANRELAISMLEYAEPYGLIAILHGFFYAFAHYALQGLSPIVQMSRARVIIITANLLFFLAVSQQLITGHVTLGIIYLLNVVPWLAISVLPRKLFGYATGTDECRTAQALALLHVGVLTGVGVLVLSSPELMGIVWCVEALLLVYLGCKFQFTSVRVEGYVALAVSLVTMVVQVVLWVAEAKVSAPVLFELRMDMGWVNLIAITILLYGTVSLLAAQKVLLTARELRIALVLNNLLSVFISLSFLMTVAIFWVQGAWLLAIIPLFYLIWRSQKLGLFFTELLGLGHLLLIVVPVVISAGMVGNFHFSEQSIYGQIARVEAFVCLWLIAEFYKRFLPNSASLGFTENLRKLFYCIIPVFFLPSILRQHGDYFPLILWASSAIALFLYHRLQFTVLKYELRILVAAASVAAITGCWIAEFEHWQGRALEALLAGFVFYAFIIWWGQGLKRYPVGTERQHDRHYTLKPLFLAAVYYVAMTLFILLYGFTANVELAAFSVFAYFFWLFFYPPVLNLVRSHLRVVYVLISSILVFLTLLHAVSPNKVVGILNIVALIAMGVLVYRISAQSRAVWRVLGGKIMHIWIFNVIAIAVYVSMVMQLFSNMQGPIVSFFLVAHATIILFQTLKPQMAKLIWLSAGLYSIAALKILLWDMNDFSLVQKIVVFMLIGMCLLGAAFKYQKVMARVGQE